jgi:hypothetical protein
MKKVLLIALFLIVGCTSPRSPDSEQATQQRKNVAVPEMVGPLTREQWAENWNIWYDTMLGSSPTVNVVKRFKGAENYTLIKRQAEAGIALRLSVIEKAADNNEPDILRFTEKVSGEYESVFITLPNGDLLLYTQIKRTE